MNKFMEGDRVVVVPHSKTMGGYKVGMEGTVREGEPSSIETIKVIFTGYEGYMYVFPEELRLVHDASAFDPQIAADYIAITNLPPLK